MQAATLPLERAPGPRGVPLFGSLFDAWKNPLELLSEGARRHGDLVRYRFVMYQYVLVSGVAEIQHILVKNQKNYRKSRNYLGLKLVLGDGLLTSEGEFWRRQRRLAQPAFHMQRLRGLATIDERADRRHYRAVERATRKRAHSRRAWRDDAAHIPHRR